MCDRFEMMCVLRLAGDGVFKDSLTRGKKGGTASLGPD